MNTEVKNLTDWTDIKEMVKDGKKVRFTHFKHDKLWYITENGFRFPVPVSDTGDGVFQSEDKAMLFMRYIRKEIEVYKSEVSSMNEKIWREGVPYTAN